MSELSNLERLPQVLVNVPVSRKLPFDGLTRRAAWSSPVPSCASTGGAACCCATRAPSPRAGHDRRGRRRRDRVPRRAARGGDSSRAALAGHGSGDDGAVRIARLRIRCANPDGAGGSGQDGVDDPLRCFERNQVTTVAENLELRSRYCLGDLGGPGAEAGHVAVAAENGGRDGDLGEAFGYGPGTLDAVAGGREVLGAGEVETGSGSAGRARRRRERSGEERTLEPRAEHRRRDAVRADRAGDVLEVGEEGGFERADRATPAPPARAR